LLFTVTVALLPQFDRLCKMKQQNRQNKAGVP